MAAPIEIDVTFHRSRAIVSLDSTGGNLGLLIVADTAAATVPFGKPRSEPRIYVPWIVNQSRPLSPMFCPSLRPLDHEFITVHAFCGLNLALLCLESYWDRVDRTTQLSLATGDFADVDTPNEAFRLVHQARLVYSEQIAQCCDFPMIIEWEKKLADI